MADSIYDIPVQTLSGRETTLREFEGRVLLIVNTASECGFTPQYAGLEELYKKYEPKGLTVLGFPCNQFGGQEPGSAEQIQSFCEKNYGVTFPMFAKLVTKAGPDQSPIYQFLGSSGSLPGWNFSKYVVGKDGKVRAFFPSKVTPDDPQLRKAIEEALAS